MIKRFIQRRINWLAEQLQLKRYRIHSVGFHGDHYLMELADLLLSQSLYFIETGTNVGSTLNYVAAKYPHIHCYSCEPNKLAYEEALHNTKMHKNVNLFNATSQEFLDMLVENNEMTSSPVLFWLDAHGYGFTWPLRQEINWITHNCSQAFILIDDFLVPRLECFGYDIYEGQVCSFDWIKEFINTKIEYHLYYPQYANRTSRHHPLRGWGLIAYGNSIQLNVCENIRQEF